MAVMINAASLAYRKASAKTRREATLDPNSPAWIQHIAEHSQEDDTNVAHTESLREPSGHRKERLFSKSTDKFERLAWYIHIHITNTTWFQFVILVNIIAIGIVTGVEIESKGHDPLVLEIAVYIADITLAVFTIEWILKTLSEAYQPWRYFTDYEYGYYNTFDFIIVALSYVFLGGKGGEISTIRMLRLVRLLDFIKYVEELRVLIAGLVSGVQSVTYICLLLLIVIYIFAILFTLLFGENDPAHFGDVTISMLSLFQVSTLASWTNIAYISWFGCRDYDNSPYSNDNPSRIHTLAGDFEGFRCDTNGLLRSLTGALYGIYVILTSWVIMSLFIGVISMGMLETFILKKTEDNLTAYAERHAANTMKEDVAETVLIKQKHTLKYKIDIVLDDQAFNYERSGLMLKRRFYDLFNLARKVKESKYFNSMIIVMILVVGGSTGYETNQIYKCKRRNDRYLNHDDDDDGGGRYVKDNCGKASDLLFKINFFAQIVFSIEALIKIIAEGNKPWKYLTDREEGGWNMVDLFVVIVGYLEYSSVGVIFNVVPIVLLRLLRLLRVARLAKTLPRLRSLVDALVKSFTSVGWIALLFAVFNYICACLCVIIFRPNDPFHFGSIGRAMFTIFRMETLDTWDQILYIAMYGCANYPGGYEFLAHDNDDDEHVHLNTQCSEKHSLGLGWVGALVIIVITIIGAYILPVVLIGIVSIHFDEATKHIDAYTKSKDELKKSVVFAEVILPFSRFYSVLFTLSLFTLHIIISKQILPGYFTPSRVDALRDMFHCLDSSQGYSLDLQEAAPFFQYSLALLFNVVNIIIFLLLCDSLFQPCFSSP